jgi:hypothetical protein
VLAIGLLVRDGNAPMGSHFPPPGANHLADDSSRRLEANDHPPSESSDKTLGRPSAFSPYDTDGYDPVDDIKSALRAIPDWFRRRIRSIKSVP